MNLIIRNANSYLIGSGWNLRRREKLKPGEQTITTGYKLTDSLDSVAKPVSHDIKDVNRYDNSFPI